MYRLFAENEKKERVELTNSPFFEVIEIDGLLPQDATISTTTFANTDGSKINSTRVEQREMTITICPRYPVEENRQKLYKYFRTKKETTLYFKNDNRDVVIAGVVNKFDGSLFEQTQTITIELLCEIPYWHDKYSTVGDMARVEDLFEFPFAIGEEGIEFSRINREMTQTVCNNGDVETGMIIELYASETVVNPKIYNVQTKEYFGLKTTMQLGDVIQINTNDLRKRVELTRYGETRNLINSIEKGNKWLKLTPGENQFTYTCDSGAEYLHVKFTFSNMYEGV